MRKRQTHFKIPIKTRLIPFPRWSVSRQRIQLGPCTIIIIIIKHTNTSQGGPPSEQESIERLSPGLPGGPSLQGSDPARVLRPGSKKHASSCHRHEKKTPNAHRKWKNMEQWNVFPKNNLSLTGPLTVQICFQTVRSRGGPFSIYADQSVIRGSTGSGVEVIAGVF